MKTPLLTEDKANKIYDILVEMGKASERMRDSFIHHHCVSEYGCNEWRFQGLLMFGGKYYSQRNIVDCYSEDYNDEREALIKEINTALSKLS